MTLCQVYTVANVIGTPPNSYEYSGSQPTGIFMDLATLQVTISLWDWLMEAMLIPVHQPTVVFSTLVVLDGTPTSACLVLCNGQLSSGRPRYRIPHV